MISNEIEYQKPIPPLHAAGIHGAYIGVGPEQNFTYVAALRPSIAFILDVRRGNRELHLLYKALFELSSDRADFLSRIFARAKAEGLTTKASARELLDSFTAAHVDEAIARRTRVEEYLFKAQSWPLFVENLRTLPATPNGAIVGTYSELIGRSGARLR